MPDGEDVFYIGTPSAGLWATEISVERRLRIAGTQTLGVAD
jgi:hypothetical protein